MKSNAIVGFLSMLLIVIYPMVNGIKTESFKDMARFIPENALLYFEQHHGSAALKEFTKSPLGKQFETIDFIDTGKKIGLSDSTLFALEEILSLYTSAKENTLFHEILGKQLAIAILSPIDATQQTNITDYIRENTIIVARPRYSAMGLDLLSEGYRMFNQTYSISSKQYGNHRIKRIKSNKETFSMVTIGGLFVMSLNEKQLRRCIDTFDIELPSLAKNADYEAIRKSFEKPDRFFYIPLNGLRKFVAQTVNDLTFAGKDLVLKELETTVGFANFGYGSWNSKVSVVDKITVQYDNNKVNSVVKNHMDTVPSRCSMLSLTTENPMAFYWSNTIKIKHLLHYFEKSREREPKLEKFWSTVENITGKNTEEIFSLLGEEVSVILEPGPKDEFFSFPLGMVFLQVKNTWELRSILEKIIDEYDIQVSVKSYGPIRYTYWTPSPQDGLQPLYGFWADLVFFGNSSKLLRMIVDRKTDDFSLLDNVNVKAIDPGFTENNNSATF